MVIKKAFFFALPTAAAPLFEAIRINIFATTQNVLKSNHCSSTTATSFKLELSPRGSRDSSGKWD